MQKRQFKTIGHSFQDETYKKRTKGHFSTSQTHTSTRETLSNMSSFTNAATNAFTTTVSLTWNQETSYIVTTKLKIGQAK